MASHSIVLSANFLLSTNDVDPRPSLPPALRAELDDILRRFCGGVQNLALSGLNVLGHPVGGTTFCLNAQSKLLASLRDDVSLLHKLVPRQASRLRLFRYCVQTRVPFYQAFDCLLPNTSLAIPASSSSLITGLHSITRSFLSDLLGLSSPLPDHSWYLATLPISLGGIGIQDPALTATISFLRPIIRSIRYSTLGLPLLDFSTPLPDDGTPLTRASLSKIWLPLPSATTALFNSWRSSPLPLFTHFRKLLPSFTGPPAQFDPGPPLTALHSFIIGPNSPFSFLKTKQKTHALASYELAKSSFPPAVLSAEPSLRSVFTSLALTELPLSVAAFRTINTLYTLALWQKLRLQVVPSALVGTPCSCKKAAIDAYGDHFYSCTACSKTPFHDRMRDTIFHGLRHVLPFTPFASSSQDIALETTGLVPSRPTLRPADVAIRLPTGSSPFPADLLLLDVTCTPCLSSSAISDDINPLNPFIRLHEEVENRKFKGRYGPSIVDELLAQHASFLPFTFDPGGLLGPFASDFLFGTSNLPSGSLPLRPTARSSTGLSNPAAVAASARATDSHRPRNLLRIADIGWHKAYPDTPFTPYYSATLPSHWFRQILGQNFVIGSAIHLYKAISKAHPVFPALPPNTTLATASSNPRFSCLRLTFPTSYNLSLSPTATSALDAPA